MDSSGHSASGGQAEPYVALLGRCTAAQPALLADQTLWKPDPTYMHSCGRQLDAHQQGRQGDDVHPVALTTRQLAVRMQARPLVFGSNQASDA